MPRKRQTQSGAPAQGRPEVAGQTYGSGVEQQQLAQVMPTPNMQATQPVVAAPQPQTMAPSYDHNAALAAVQGLGREAGLLTQETQRPGEPVTAGLTRGPGPGPEILGAIRGTPAGDMFRRLSAETGDPLFASIADRARA